MVSRDSFLEQIYKKGMRINDLVNEANVTYTVARNWMIKNKHYAPKQTGKSDFIFEESYKEGMTVEELAEATEYCVKTTRKWMVDKGYIAKQRNVSDFVFDELYKDGMTVDELAYVSKYSHKTVRKWMVDNDHLDIPRSKEDRIRDINSVFYEGITKARLAKLSCMSIPTISNWVKDNNIHVIDKGLYKTLPETKDRRLNNLYEKGMTAKYLHDVSGIAYGYCYLWLNRKLAKKEIEKNDRRRKN